MDHTRMCCFLYIHICIYIYIHTSVVGVPLPGSGCQQHQQASVHQRLLERRPGARGLVPCVRARDLTEAEGHASAFITAVLLGIALSRLASESTIHIPLLRRSRFDYPKLRTETLKQQ